MNEKMFFITRADLPPGDRAAQSLHSAIVFTLTYPDLVREWHDKSNNVVLLEAKNEDALLKLAARAAVNGVPLCTFSEPNLGNQMTAIALGPSGYRLVSSLPLTLKQPKQAA